jgi:hypothetical protein
MSRKGMATVSWTPRIPEDVPGFRGAWFEAPKPREEVAAASGGGWNSVRLSHAPHEGHFPAHFEKVSPQSLQAKTVFLAFLTEFLAMNGI